MNWSSFSQDMCKFVDMYDYMCSRCLKLHNEPYIHFSSKHVRFNFCSENCYKLYIVANEKFREINFERSKQLESKKLPSILK